MTCVVLLGGIVLTALCFVRMSVLLVLIFVFVFVLITVPPPLYVCTGRVRGRVGGEHVAPRHIAIRQGGWTTAAKQEALSTVRSVPTARAMLPARHRWLRKENQRAP